MDMMFIIFAVILAVLGLFGAVVPMIPGPPLSFVALLLVLFCENVDISSATLWVMGAFMVLVTIFDYIAPIWFTNLKGGSKSAINGATIGMIAGLFFLPLGIIIGPFLGAFIGELIANSSKSKALDVAFASFMAFLITSGVKILYSAIVIVILFKQLFDVLFSVASN